MPCIPCIPPCPMSAIVSSTGSRSGGTGARAPGREASVATAMPDRSIASATIVWAAPVGSTTTS